jgi:OTU domain-containing protein 3
LQAGRKGRNGWTSQLDAELANLGLRVQEVAADGSCFFRSLADQLEGRSGDHRQLRTTIIKHIETKRELYEPFIEDDEKFDDYIDRMAEEGTWAGNLELQAASIVLNVNLKVYQAGQPPWIVANFPQTEVRMLHISYHDGMHYNSVRLLDDVGTGPPEPIPVYSNSNLDSNNNSGTGSGGSTYSEGDLRRVKDGTGCDGEVLIVAALDKVRGNVDAAIEALVEELRGEDRKQEEEGGEVDSSSKENIQDNNCTAENEQGKVSEKVVEVELEVSRGGKGKRVRLLLKILGEEKEESDTDGIQKIEVDAINSKKSSKTKGNKGKSKKNDASEPARNSRCPCGSTKKYKNCCGATKTARARAQNNENTIEVPHVSTAMETLYI